MKALTIWQPWATLIMIGAKPFEFRGWNFAERRDLAALVDATIVIHAGVRPVRRAEIADLLLRLRGDEAWTTGLVREKAEPLLDRAHAAPGLLPLASGLGTVRLGRPRRSGDIIQQLGGPVNDSDRAAHANWAWPVSDIRPFDHPRPARGAQGFWNWSDQT